MSSIKDINGTFDVQINLCFTANQKGGRKRQVLLYLEILHFNVI